MIDFGNDVKLVAVLVVPLVVASCWLPILNRANGR